MARIISDQMKHFRLNIIHNKITIGTCFFSGILFAIALFIPGCTKDKAAELPNACADKQLPGEYFPAYPKSWWDYRNQSNELIQYSIANDYMDCYGKCRPYFNNLNMCLQGENMIFSIYVGQGNSAVIGSPIYSTTAGEVLFCMLSFSTFEYRGVFVSGHDEIPWRRLTLTTDTSITLSNQQTFHNVIIVKETNIYKPGWLYFDYFSKNIGLIKRDSASVNDSTQLTQILMLEDYHIGD